MAGVLAGEARLLSIRGAFTLPVESMSPESPRAQWRNPKAWQALRSGRGCPICREAGPQDIIAELKASWVTAPEVAPLPGYACVVSKRHVVEPFDLPRAERALFWEDAMLAAKALANVLRPIKMNYEIHGNTVPHLHLHLLPRFLGDPYEGGPIDPSRASFRRSRTQLAALRRAILASSVVVGRREGREREGKGREAPA
jgi:diadenosine tetraphosphate (Ap4A) HIT family hydrolase